MCRSNRGRSEKNKNLREPSTSGRKQGDKSPSDATHRESAVAGRHSTRKVLIKYEIFSAIIVQCNNDIKQILIMHEMRFSPFTQRCARAAQTSEKLFWCVHKSCAAPIAVLIVHIYDVFDINHLIKTILERIKICGPLTILKNISKS